MSKITISVDKCGDLPQEVAEKLGIKQIYFGVAVGGELYSDKDFKAEDVYKAVEVDNILPKTNAGLEVDYRELFEEATKDGGSIIHVSISDKLSASHSNAKRAAEGMERVYLINSKSLSGGIGLLAMKAHEFMTQGLPAPEIVKKVKAIRDNVDGGFIVNDLKYLHRGGRVSGLKLLGANLLKIRPSLILEPDGRMVPGKKFKGDFAKACQEYTKYRIEKNPNADKSFVFILNTDIDKKISDQMIADLKAAGFKEVMHAVAGATITTHCGRNTIGFFIMNQG